MTSAAADLDALVAKHADLLENAQRAARTREYWSAFPESPSPRVYGEDAAAEGEQAFRALLGTTLDLGQPTDGTQVGSESSPYGLEIGVRYPRASADQLVEASRIANRAWRSATPIERAAVCAEILVRINRRSFELAHAVMHTSGQAFVMAFQAGGPNAQDRGLEATAYALTEQTRHASSVLWEKPQGKRPPLRMTKEFTPVARGIGLVVCCNTFPTWNAYPGIFASLATGNTVIVKPHPHAVLPLAVTVSIAREVLAEFGFDPNVVLLAPEDDGDRLAADLALDPQIGIVDFTGSTAFGEWLERNARQALVYTEKAGVNSVIFESTDAYRAALGNLAFTLSLYSGQMCTTTQNILIPAEGVQTDEGVKTRSEFAIDLGEAMDKLLGDDEKAAALLGGIVSDDVAKRLNAASASPDLAVSNRQVNVAEWPDARIYTPVVLLAKTSDDHTYTQECFGPVSFLVETATRDEAIDAFAEMTKEQGALTAGVYSTDEAYLERVREAALDAGVSLSENLTGGVFVNQTAAFSDFHATGANPAANATYVDGHFVAGRFRFIGTRRHAPDA
ncbi:phenylacetic acid degradation protein PaaN [Solicola gregarius]|uniref:Phenylacetic acid degradation protein PaaN n=1 Tax=Solicola gregarius TaxID=2908642 RepID=A0AA46TKA9_9ACTN|nr:phenylacetic acid degradation protein PaaN [Solicola gregarius]UYM06469.1 phenylacetic acid degradation protein PaaN [Solicola gregarius]